MWVREVVSAIIPTTGRVSVVRAVESAARQTVPLDELILVLNTNSLIHEGLIDACEKAADRVPLRVIRMPSTGRPGPPRSAGLAIAASELVAFLDDDDSWLPQKTALQLAALSRHSVGAVGNASVSSIDGTTRDYFSSMPDRISLTHLRRSNWVITSTALCNADALRRSGAFLNEPFEDYKAWARLCLLGDLDVVAEPVASYSSGEVGRFSELLENQVPGTAPRDLTIDATAEWVRSLRGIRMRWRASVMLAITEEIRNRASPRRCLRRKARN